MPHIRVVSVRGDELLFTTIEADTCLAVVAQQVAQRLKFITCDVNLLFGNAVLLGHETPSTVPLEDGATVVAVASCRFEKAIYFAKLAEQAERYDEMASCMREAIEIGQELSVEERNLMSVAYKNAVGSRRAAWHIHTSIEQKEPCCGNEKNAEFAREYIGKVETELKSFCGTVFALLDGQLLHSASTPESKAFYLKMKADYHRYLAEISKGAAKREEAESSRKAYEEANRIVCADLPATHPTRLGSALSYSVFNYEVLGNRAEACKMARKAFENAIAELDNLDEDSYKDSTLIMQLLRDNLILWTSDQDGAAAP